MFLIFNDQRFLKILFNCFLSAWDLLLMMTFDIVSFFSNIWYLTIEILELYFQVLVVFRHFKAYLISPIRPIGNFAWSIHINISLMFLPRVHFFLSLDFRNRVMPTNQIDLIINLIWLLMMKQFFSKRSLVDNSLIFDFQRLFGKLFASFICPDNIWLFWWLSWWLWTYHVDIIF